MHGQYFKLSVMHGQYFKLYYCFCLLHMCECDILELGKIFLLDSIWSILFFCLVLHFCISIHPLLRKKVGKILDLLNHKKHKKYKNKNLSKNQTNHKKNQKSQNKNQTNQDKNYNKNLNQNHKKYTRIRIIRTRRAK